MLGAACFLATGLATVTATAQVQSPTAAARDRAGWDRIVRLDKALGAVAKDSDGSGALSILTLLVGVAYTGVGIALAVNPDQEPRGSGLRGLVVTENVLIGSFCFGYGATRGKQE
jgi:hypothetical protein